MIDASFCVWLSHLEADKDAEVDIDKVLLGDEQRGGIQPASKEEEDEAMGHIEWLSFQ